MDEQDFTKVINDIDLYETNNFLIKRFYQKYKLYCLNIGYDLNDLIQEIWIGIWNDTLKKHAYKDKDYLKKLITKNIKWALSHFRSRKLKLTNKQIKEYWEGRKNNLITNEALISKFEVGKMNKSNLDRAMMDLELYRPTTVNNHKELELIFMLDSFNDILNTKEILILRKRFLENKKWKEIAKEMKISLTYVIMLYDETIKKLKKHLKKREF
jgi:RNA polymerase sigma factor (sigma-70 family)